jgi:hypothetical protein
LKVLFDEDVPRKLARCLPRHEIHTVGGMQWGAIKNGALLKLIELEGFQCFLLAIRTWRTGSGWKAVPLPR